MNKQETAQAYIDTNGRPHSVWEVGVEWIIDPDFDKSFNEWFESYKKNYYPLTAKESDKLKKGELKNE